MPCVFIARRFQLFLASSTPVELCLPTLGALSSWSFYIFANKFNIPPRRDSKSRTNTINSSIRGLTLVHRGDRCQLLIQAPCAKYCAKYCTGSCVHSRTREAFIEADAKNRPASKIHTGFRASTTYSCTSFLYLVSGSTKIYVPGIQLQQY